LSIGKGFERFSSPTFLSEVGFLFPSKASWLQEGREVELRSKEKAMGCYDTVIVPCPKCGTEAEFQSKGGDCLLRVYSLADCPEDVLSDVNRHAPYTCEKCGTIFEFVKQIA
jgi:RNase P subunit RPR2